MSPSPEYDRVGSDQTRAILAGFVVASIFAYIAVKAQEAALSTSQKAVTFGPPFSFPGHDPLYIGFGLGFLYAADILTFSF